MPEEPQSTGLLFEQLGLKVLNKFEVLLCRRCKCGIDPRHVFAHLGGVHGVPRDWKVKICGLVQEA